MEVQREGQVAQSLDVIYFISSFVFYLVISILNSKYSFSREILGGHIFLDIIVQALNLSDIIYL